MGTKRMIILLIALLFNTSLVFLMACAHRMAQPDITTGNIGRAMFDDCRVNSATGTIKCRCDTFALSVDAKTGLTHVRCPK